MRSEALDRALDPTAFSELERLDANRRKRRLFAWQNDGRLVPRGPQDPGLLPSPGIESDLLATSQSWTVVRPVEPVRPARKAPKTRVVAAGELGPKGISSVDLLSFFGSHQRTGILTLSIFAQERAVYLVEGRICWASSTVSEERLGPQLVAREKLSPDQLQSFRKVDDKALGERLIEEGILSVEELWEAVRVQAEAIIDSLVVMEDGFWTFTHIDDPEPLQKSSLQLPAQMTLIQAMHRLDEARRSSEPETTSAPARPSVDRPPLPKETEPTTSSRDIQEKLLPRHTRLETRRAKLEPRGTTALVDPPAFESETPKVVQFPGWAVQRAAIQLKQWIHKIVVA